MKNKQGKSNYYNIFFIKSQVEFMIKIEIINVVNLKINQFVFFFSPKILNIFFCLCETSIWQGIKKEKFNESKIWAMNFKVQVHLARLDN